MTRTSRAYWRADRRIVTTWPMMPIGKAEHVAGDADDERW